MSTVIAGESNGEGIKVDFYVLNDAKALSRLQFVCRLCEKLGKLQHSITVGCDREQDAKQLDALLWEYPPESFLPHEVLTQPTQAQANSPFPAVILVNRDVSEHHAKVFINLGAAPQNDNQTYSRLVEVVIQDPLVLEQTRAHFKFYRERSYPIQSHPINTW